MKYYSRKRDMGYYYEYEDYDNHVNLVMKYLDYYGLDRSIKFLRELNYGEVRYNNELSGVYREIMRGMFKYHDYGKKTALFQSNKLGVTVVGGGSTEGNSNHSMKGAIYFNFKMRNYVEDTCGKISKEDSLFIDLLLDICTYVISRHHSKLVNYSDYLSSLEEFKEIELKQVQEEESFSDVEIDMLKLISKSNRVNNMLEHSIYEYSLVRDLRGLLSLCDHFATTEYMSGENILPDRVEPDGIQSAVLRYMDTPHFNSISREQQGIMKARVDIIKEMDKNMINNGKDYACIDFMEAPTGAGKTHASWRYAISHLEDGGKIIYSTQFNNVSEQTYNYYCEMLGITKEFTVSINNSTSEITKLDESYDSAFQKESTLENQLNMISNQRLLNILYGGNIKDAKAYSSLQNSIIIVDELQDISVKLWKSLFENLNILINYFNCRVLLMSATLPRLNKLFGDGIKVNELVRDRSLIENTVFRDRVEVKDDLFTKYSIMNQDIFPKILGKMKENLGKRQIIEFISKKDAYEFERYLKEKNLDTKLYIITGDTNSLERIDILNEISKEDEDGNYIENNFIVIATQVIEAGVDIDCEIGYKDVSKYDSEEQFKGRLNRNGKFAKGYLYLFNKMIESIIYDKYRTVKISNNYVEDVRNFSYDKYYDKIINILISEDINIINNLIKERKYDDISKESKISEDMYNLYIIDAKYKEYSAREIYDEYEEILSSRMKYSEKMIKLSRINKKLSYFKKSIYVSKKTTKNAKDNLIRLDIDELNLVTEDEYYILVGLDKEDKD